LSEAVARDQLLHRGGGPVGEVDEHDTQAAARLCGALAACCLKEKRTPQFKGR
jgi:hypothetical protein